MQFSTSYDSAKKGIIKMGRVILYHAFSAVLTLGTVYATRYNVHLSDLNLHQAHDLVVGLIYIGWNLVAVYITTYIEKHKADGDAAAAIDSILGNPPPAGTDVNRSNFVAWQIALLAHTKCVIIKVLWHNLVPQMVLVTRLLQLRVTLRVGDRPPWTWTRKSKRAL